MSHHISTVTGCPATLPQPLPCTTLHHLSCEIKKEGLSHMGLGPGNAAALLQYTVWAIIGDCKQCIALCSIAALLSDTIALVLGTPGTGDSFIHCNSSWSQLLWSMCASFPPLVGSIAYIPALPTCTKMCIIKEQTWLPLHNHVHMHAGSWSCTGASLKISPPSLSTMTPAGFSAVFSLSHPEGHNNFHYNKYILSDIIKYAWKTKEKTCWSYFPTLCPLFWGSTSTSI